MNKDSLKKIIILLILITGIFSFSANKNNLKNISKPVELVETSFGRILISGDYVSKGQDYRQKFIILHYTALDKEKSLSALTKNNVSSHFLITDDKNDVIYNLVSEDKRAWHAGVSNWKGRTNINDSSIGIEIVNLGNSNGEFIPYEDFQIENTAILIKYLIDKYDMLPQNILGHSDIAPQRKSDPGPLFPWEYMYKKYGIGMWYDADIKEKYINEYINIFDNISVSEIQIELKKFGYEIDITNIFDRQTKNVVKAFQFHFRNEKCDGIMDLESFSILKALNEKYNNIER